MTKSGLDGLVFALRKPGREVQCLELLAFTLFGNCLPSKKRREFLMDFLRQDSMVREARAFLLAHDKEY